MLPARLLHLICYSTNKISNVTDFQNANTPLIPYCQCMTKQYLKNQNNVQSSASTLKSRTTILRHPEENNRPRTWEERSTLLNLTTLSSSVYELVDIFAFQSCTKHVYNLFKAFQANNLKSHSLKNQLLNATKKGQPIDMQS